MDVPHLPSTSATPEAPPPIEDTPIKGKPSQHLCSNEANQKMSQVCLGKRGLPTWPPSVVQMFLFFLACAPSSFAAKGFHCEHHLRQNETRAKLAQQVMVQTSKKRNREKHLATRMAPTLARFKPCDCRLDSSPPHPANKQTKNFC